MLSNPPSTGDAKLDNFLKSVKRHIDDALRPKDGWRLSDFSADVSEVISDKRDLIDIVTRYDDINVLKDSVDRLLADYAETIADHKAIGKQYEDHAEVFTHTMEWWNQNRRIIEDAAAAMAATLLASDYADAAEASAARAGNHEDGASKAKDDAVTAKNQAVTAKNQASTSATNAATSASNAKTSETNAKTSETRAKTSETNAKTSETRAKTSETNAKTSETNAEDAAERAKTSETTATGHATQTADDRRQTGEDRTQTGLDRKAAAQSATNAATSADKAETHEDTSLEASAAAIVAAVSVAQYQGRGFPEGKVSAPVGSIYTDLDATAGAIRWIKASGTGNTGWQVEPNADTVTALATWTADAVGGRNHFSYTHLSNLENWHPATYFVLKEVIQLEPNAEYTFHAEEVTADAEGEWTVFNLMDGTDGVLPYKASNPNRIRTIYNRNNQGEPEYGLNVRFTAPSSGKVYFEFYPHGKFGEEAKPFWVTEKLVRAQIVRGREVPEWRPSPEDAVAGLTGDGESTSPLLPFDPALALRADNSVGTRVFVGDTMIHGDTGWRRLDTLLVAENFAGGSLAVRRVGNTVDVVGYSISAHEDSGDLKMLATLPSGLLPGHTARYGTTYWGKRWNINPSGVISLGQTAGGDYFNATFITSQPWPTTLPGTPA